MGKRKWVHLNFEKTQKALIASETKQSPFLVMGNYSLRFLDFYNYGMLPYRNPLTFPKRWLLLAVEEAIRATKIFLIHLNKAKITKNFLKNFW